MTSDDDARSAGPLPLAGLFFGALALRAALLLAVSHASGWKPADLALLYDGHLYAIAARTLPALYQGLPELVPFVTTFRDATFLTGWFPLYPILIGAVDLVVGELRTSALLVSQTAAAAAVVAFHVLARERLARVWPATLAFACLPPTWLMVGSFAFCEPLLLLFAILAVREQLRGRLARAALFAGLASVAQKSGLLVPLVVGASVALEGRHALRRALAVTAGGLLPLAALQLYLWASFGDPFVNLRVAREAFVGGVGVPFLGLLRGLLAPDLMLPMYASLRKLLIACSALFYALAGFVVMRDSARHPPAIRLWLLGALLLVFSMSGPWAYYGAPRYALLAAPPALLVFARRLESRPGWQLGIALACAAALSVGLVVLELEVGLDLCLRVWSARYYRMLPGALD